MLVWDDLRYFLAVHRTRSHAAAARSLRVAATTVGRRVAALEAGIGSRLFTRTPEGLVATAAARALLAHAERMEVEAQESELLLSGADARPTGLVRLTCGDGFATAILAPGLPAFLASHPGLEVEIRAEPRVLDLTRGEADVALRNVRPRERSLVARRLGLERYGMFAAPSYLARRGTPRSPKDLAGHDLVLYDREYDRLRSQVWLRQVAGGARVAVRASNTMTLHAACAAGAGIALLSTAFIRDDARFTRLLPRFEPPADDLWTATHADLRSAARVAVTLRWLDQLVREAGMAL
ncbi:MAG TPA: LysR family transcriptional regulator [Vicinamibacteria bacterium]